MGKARLKTHLYVIYFLAFLLPSALCHAQQSENTRIVLSGYLQELEQKFEVKFSYVDADIADVMVTRSEDSDLSAIIRRIVSTTQLTITQLNDRYYTIAKGETVTVCAYVLDNFEKNTIPGATVVAMGSPIGTTTDTNGYFALENIPRNTMLQIKYLGFKPFFIPAEKLTGLSECMVIAMVQNYQELDEVIVYKFLTTGIAKLKDGSFELDTSQFGILPGLIEPDILQSVQALPGIKSVDETVSDINIRGGTNDQNLILWDGIKMYQSGHFFGLISAFNPYLTDKVNVIKNGTSAAYGGGVSGVLDMHTPNTLGTIFKGGAGFNMISGDAYGHLPINQNLSVQFSARRSLTDFLQTPTYTTFSEKAFQDSKVEGATDFYFYDFSGKVLYDINNYQRLRISLINLDNKLNYSKQDTQNGTQDQNTLTQSNFSMGGIWESDWTDIFKTQLSTYITEYQLFANSYFNSTGQILYQNNQVKETGAKLHTQYNLNHNWQWTNGYEFAETGIENSTYLNEPLFDSRIKGVVRSHALYSAFEYQSDNERVFAKFGGRLNYYINLDTFKDIVIEPRLNASYKLIQNFNLEILGEFKSQSANQIIDMEQNFLGIEKRRWILSNGTTLPITKSKQGSIGLNYDKNNFYVGIEAFYKHVAGINIATQGFQSQNQFNGEVGGYNNKGVEFLINTKNNDYSAWLSYTYNNNAYNFSAITPPNFPNNLHVRHSVTLAGNYTLDHFKFGLGVNYRSGKPYTRPDAQDPVNTNVVPNEINYEQPNSSRISEYIRADASATYHFMLGDNIKASVGASVLNFTDRKNVLNIYYRLNGQNEVETIKRISLGVTPNASFRVFF